ncbi:MAG: hypothetical protein OEV64_14760, partial [Desulfobulbaceae bacterium]|nr:hypothetical protein [Desulfobulbaceae bacterium]
MIIWKGPGVLSRHKQPDILPGEEVPKGTLTDERVLKLAADDKVEIIIKKVSEPEQARIKTEVVIVNDEPG